MSQSIGLRIVTEIDRAPRELVEQFRGIPSSNISDMMNRFYCMHEYIRAMNGVAMVGTALTVKTVSCDNLMIHYALDMAQPGDVLVVDGGSDVNRALMGEIMFTYAQQRGLAGVVVDGGIRDVDCLATLPLPVYAKGVTPQGPYKNGPGEINLPVACGGQVVFPGDILVGDKDGVVVIRKEDAPTLIEAARKKLQSEEELLGRYRRGQLDAEQHKKEYEEMLKAMGARWI